MKPTFYLLLLLAVAVACGKKTDAVVPKGTTLEAATRLAGTYEISSVESPELGFFTYPLSVTHTDGLITTQTAQVVLVRRSETSVDMTYIDKETGQPDAVTNVGIVDIEGNDLYLGETRLGTIDGTTLVFSDESGTITAQKK